MVLLSTLTFVLSTLEELQEDENGVTEFPVIVLIIQLMDNFVIIFFTIEYFLRLVVCPNKTKFIKDAMNMVLILVLLNTSLTLNMNLLSKPLKFVFLVYFCFIVD